MDPTLYDDAAAPASTLCIRVEPRSTGHLPAEEAKRAAPSTTLPAPATDTPTSHPPITSGQQPNFLGISYELQRLILVQIITVSAWWAF
jgi:hypothetical protein